MIEYVSFGVQWYEGFGSGWTELPTLLSGQTGGHYIDQDGVMLTGLSGYHSGSGTELKVYVNDRLLTWIGTSQLQSMGRFSPMAVPLDVGDRIRVYGYMHDLHEYVGCVIQLRSRRE